MDAIHEEKYRDLNIKIYQDEDPESPREWDNLGKMICWHRNYDLGDKHNYDEIPDFIYCLAEEAGVSFDDLENRTTEELTLILKSKGYRLKPLYLYDHSGITISTAPFSCRWDSGQVGYIYVDPAMIRKEYGNSEDPEILKRVNTVLDGEVYIYDQYVRGNVYGFMITDQDGQDIDSCWGFYGDYEDKDGALSEAHRVIDSLTNKGKTDHHGQHIAGFMKDVK